MTPDNDNVELDIDVIHLLREETIISSIGEFSMSWYGSAGVSFASIVLSSCIGVESPFPRRIWCDDGTMQHLDADFRR